MEQLDGAASTLEALRPELARFCYRMLGSAFDADDAVQDTVIRAWEHWDDLSDEAARRSWIYRIASNICLDRIRAGKRRALPMDLNNPTSPARVPEETLSPEAFIWPFQDPASVGDSLDPSEAAVRRDSIRLAFVAALQTLSGRQRAVLILKDVFRWSSAETASSLNMTVAAVNSALQRARAALRAQRLRSDDLRHTDGVPDRDLLERYMHAFERLDIPAMVALFHENGSLSMPPFPMWVEGHEDLASFYEATADHCRGSRLLPVTVNDVPAFAQYSPGPTEGVLVPWGIHVPEVDGGRIRHLHTFIDPALYPRFGLPTSVSRH